MKQILSFALSMLVIQCTSAQTATPDKLWGALFKEVQMQRAMGDNKTFVDMVPQFKPEDILKKFERLQQRDSASLRAFVLANFYLPSTTAPIVQQDVPLDQHLNTLWKSLSRKADTARRYSSLLPLPNDYIVPGGRFREIYYWDSYFTMQGLAVSNRYDLIEDMLDNFKFLIDKYGHIPNGNRNYYLSRSQPPYFALMVQLLQAKKGNSVYRKYYAALQKEYAFWMQGSTKLVPGTASRRVVKLEDGAILNRYFDDNNAPRQESYFQDVKTAEEYAGKDNNVFVNLRAGAESGWDFSSRWFGDTLHLSTIKTTDIIPVDLNSLLYQYEQILSQAATVVGQSAKAAQYKQGAAKRKAAVQKYCWNPKLNYFFDYDFKQAQTTDKWSLAGVMPLFSQVATDAQAAGVRAAIESRFLKKGGVVTTVYNTGQQWDAPNGWAPLQFITVMGLTNYKHTALARTIGERWMAVNERVFKSTGKMLEKYNVENIDLESGGGEYPTQDGFGWSNGVYLKFNQMYKRPKAPAPKAF